MAQRRFHYEQAFEHYLRANRVPYVAVDEAKKALAPATSTGDKGPGKLKSFDFVVYAPQGNLLIDVKGRMYGRAPSATPRADAGVLSGGHRFESWVTRDDVDCLQQWERLFGEEFKAVFVFAYCLRRQPPDALFEEVFEYGGRWYALRQVAISEYAQHMVCRSGKWETVHVPSEVFARISTPFTVRDVGGYPETHDSPRSRRGRRSEGF